MSSSPLSTSSIPLSDDGRLVASNVISKLLGRLDMAMSRMDGSS